MAYERKPQVGEVIRVRLQGSTRLTSLMTVRIYGGGEYLGVSVETEIGKRTLRAFLAGRQDELIAMKDETIAASVRFFQSQVRSFHKLAETMKAAA